MKIFLKLPKEILVLIIRFINDKSKILELATILPLRNLALEVIFSTYHVVRNCKNGGDGCIEILKSLYHQYKFKPFKIIGEIWIINELLNFGKSGSITMIPDCHRDYSDAVDYSMSKFEILIERFNNSFELEKIMNHVNVVGIDMLYGESGCPADKDIEAHSYLKAFKSTNLESLRTTYEASFKVEFPTSLKHLNLHFEENEAIKLDLGTLVSLEYFECKNLFGMVSLKDLNFSNSIKGLKLYSCGFEKLGNIKSLNRLKMLSIFGCENLIDFIKCPFPDSLSYIDYDHCVSASKVTELYESAKNGLVQQFDLFDFSDDGTSFYLGPNINFPKNLQTLYISDSTKTLELGSELKLKNVDVLQLKHIPKIDLTGLLASLPKVMSGLLICGSLISTFEGIALFPDLATLQLEQNVFENIFRTNIDELKNLSILKLKHNISIQSEEDIRIDPFQLLSIDDSISTMIQASETFETKFNEKSDIVNLRMQKMMNLALVQTTHIELDPNTFNIIDPNISQVSFIGCENLKFLTLFGLDIEVLKINHFPLSLEYLTIQQLELQSVEGNFGNLIKLKELILRENGIDDSMLSSQTFPISLKTLDLSKNEINDLNCLKLNICVNLENLFLYEVATQVDQKGANELKELFFKLTASRKTYHIALSTRYEYVIYEIIDGANHTHNHHSLYNDEDYSYYRYNWD
ncbi:uncharacterized protein KGF55_003616 [Candida pseudojiufengensis]|uniref:uncharacterized protein n=1 Tax=Candida pseudojiufengensis TaxID=497109 RepID=UPI002224DB6B|nr:uncharacterized protein KGF55_003616 [Candida pseudojiufengensis]KAI5962540.1 hypothetical protein KGF55_003616 [Candida pseudojiufengensis]